MCSVSPISETKGIPAKAAIAALETKRIHLMGMARTREHRLRRLLPDRNNYGIQLLRHRTTAFVSVDDIGAGARRSDEKTDCFTCLDYIKQRDASKQRKEHNTSYENFTRNNMHEAAPNSTDHCRIGAFDDTPTY